MRLRLDSQERKLDALLIQINGTQDDEIKAHLSKYFCVRVSGYLENVIKSLVANYSEGTSPQAVSTYVQNTMKNVTNLSEEKLTKLLKKFNEDWESTFLDKVSDQQLESLNSLISNRNSIAHGQQDNISHRYIGQYYSDVKGIVMILKEIIKK
ncbi:MAG: HEPN domain-containing protein [Salinivirgaceae bacterium]